MGFQILVCKSLVVSSYCWKLRHNGYGRINTEVPGSNYKRRRGRHNDNHGENEDEMRKSSCKLSGWESGAHTKHQQGGIESSNAASMEKSEGSQD